MIEGVRDDAEIAGAWGRFLHRHPWSWYCHLTFRGSPSVEKALHTLRYWMHCLNAKQFGSHYARRGRQGIRHVRGLEHQRRGSPHFHLLMIETSRLSIDHATREWKRLAGDALIQPFDRSKGGAFYVAKVYGPGGTGALDFGGEWTTSDRLKLSGTGRRAGTECRPGE